MSTPRWLRTRRQASAEQERYPLRMVTGICGDVPPILGLPSGLPAPYCELLAGHAGMHSDGHGSHWTLKPTEETQ